MDTSSHFVTIESPKPSAVVPGLTLEWSNVTLKANVKNPTTKSVDEKVILNDVSGYAKPGELLVLMGPSGAGKSSLLDCISGRNPNVHGRITVNGQPWSKSLKRLASYVMQDDLFYATITVREHLLFQAKLRMGKTHTVEQQIERVNTVMEELGLTKTRDTLIGGPSLRGISGGERKRLSFATEILTNPSLLFVDEPTSGLDSFMAEAVVLQLQQIARDGRTVIATIHQPSSEIYALFDKLYLLSDGAPVYHGKAADAVPYFASLGYACPPFLNPSDYFMRQLVVLDKATDAEGVARVESFKTAWRGRRLELAPSPSNLDDTMTQRSSESEDTSDASTRVGFIGQMGILAKRNFVQLSRDPLAFRASVFASLFVSLMVGLIYLQLDLNQRGVQNFVGAFFFLIVNQVFSAANPTFLAVPLELPIIEREYKSGLYRLLAWYLSKNVSELPFQTLLPIVSFLPAYLLIGVGGGVETYIKMQVIIFLVNSCAVGLGYLVSCWVRRVDIAPIIGVVLILPFLLFGGLLINSDDAPDYFVWIQYISPIKYGFEALMKIFWGHITAIPCDAALETCAALSGAEVLRTYSMTSRSALGDGLLLLAIDVSFRALGFVGLWSSLRSRSNK
ncbi:hypothetical protein ATCC90586_011719 [Pythium insidiosum]|nr:hypothetical protein ATCC90586_011719 [Pythium insidiosum]